MHRSPPMKFPTRHENGGEIRLDQPPEAAIPSLPSHRWLSCPKTRRPTVQCALGLTIRQKPKLQSRITSKNKSNAWHNPAKVMRNHSSVYLQGTPTARPSHLVETHIKYHAHC